jgi:hypothetical protein
VGKTSVVCGLIRSLSEAQWTAVKLTAHGHTETVQVLEEKRPGSGNDSERYLTAGAARSYLISAPEGGLWRAIPKLLDILAGAKNAIVESTSVLEYLRPELALAVVDPAAKMMKRSLRRTMGRFSAVVSAGEGPLGGALKELEAKPRFVVCPPEYGSLDLNAFVRNALKK